MITLLMYFSVAMMALATLIGLELNLQASHPTIEEAYPSSQNLVEKPVLESRSLGRPSSSQSSSHGPAGTVKGSTEKSVLHHLYLYLQRHPQCSCPSPVGLT